MCVVSMVGDHYRDNWTQPFWPPQKDREPDSWTKPYWPIRTPRPGHDEILPPPSWAEFDKLKEQVEELKRLLKRAKSYDERNGEPDCEIDEKMDLLRKVAALVDVSLDDVIGKKAA